jgi:hypothetical protein
VKQEEVHVRQKLLPGFALVHTRGLFHRARWSVLL